MNEERRWRKKREKEEFAPVMGVLCPHMLFSFSPVTGGGMCCAGRQMVSSRFLSEPGGSQGGEVAGNE